MIYAIDKFYLKNLKFIILKYIELIIIFLGYHTSLMLVVTWSDPRVCMMRRPELIDGVSFQQPFRVLFYEKI